MGCSLPINDVYGSEEQMYKEPDALYQTSRRGSPTGITNKAEGKDLATLFTYLDWTYTEEGSKTIRFGLTADQYASVKLDPDLYADYDIETAYTESTDENGKKVYTMTFEDGNPILGALGAARMDVGLKMTGNTGEYTKEGGDPLVNKMAKEQWTKFTNTGNVFDYSSLLNAEESEVYSKIGQQGTDYQSANVPNVIKGTMSWDEYVKGLEDIDTDAVVELLQKYVDLANSAK